MFSLLPFKLLLSVLIGAAIGLQRESNGQADAMGSAGGIRTFSLITLLGGLAGFFYLQNVHSLFLVLAVFMAALVLVYYSIGTYVTKRSGLTNEIAIVFSFLIGFLITTEMLSTQITLALLVVLLLILSLKSHTQKLMLGISQEEVLSFVSYAIIALVVLPFLPNVPVYLSNIPFISTMLDSFNVNLGRFETLELFNPRKIWFIVVLVTGIDVFGYVLGRIFGHKKSFTLTSFVGGFISSTSTTQSLAQKSKKTGIVNSLVGAALIANMASFFQIFLLVGPLNSNWLAAIAPTVLLLIVSSFAFGFYFLSRKESKTVSNKNGEAKEGKRQIFSLVPAMKFALLIISVKLVTKICLVFFGQSGFIISSVIASFAGIDAIVINLADMAGKSISFQMALFTLILVNATNLLSKSLFTFLQGNRSFAYRFLLSVGGIIAVSFVGLLM